MKLSGLYDLNHYLTTQILILSFKPQPKMSMNHESSKYLVQHSNECQTYYIYKYISLSLSLSQSAPSYDIVSTPSFIKRLLIFS